MKILMLTGDIPTPLLADQRRPFYFLKILSQKYHQDISLLSLKENTNQLRYVYDLDEYCNQIETITVPENVGLTFKSQREIFTLKNMFSLQNVFSRKHSFLNTFYTPAMERKVREILRRDKFDVVYAHPLNMSFYILDVNLPKVIDCMDAAFNAWYRLYQLESNPIRKIALWLLYYRIKRDLKCAYKAKINKFMVVSSQERDILKSYLPDANVAVIPNGIDVDYFRPMPAEEDFPSLLFVGSMMADSNIAAVSYFCDHIFPLIKMQLPNVKLYIVGRHPPKKIQLLALNSSIFVSGYVDDVRPYLAHASVVIAPMVTGGGVKNKVLEALAMAKPVITTSIGAQGIDVSPEKDIVIADEPKEFAKRAVELLGDEQLRQRIGNNGRRMVENGYSWERSADLVNELFRSIGGKK